MGTLPVVSYLSHMATCNIITWNSVVLFIPSGLPLLSILHPPLGEEEEEPNLEVVLDFWILLEAQKNKSRFLKLLIILDSLEEHFQCKTIIFINIIYAKLMDPFCHLGELLFSDNWTVRCLSPNFTGFVPFFRISRTFPGLRPIFPGSVWNCLSVHHVQSFIRTISSTDKKLYW